LVTKREDLQLQVARLWNDCTRTVTNAESNAREEMGSTTPNVSFRRSFRELPLIADVEQLFGP
jgi:hypothetical protein